MKRHTLVCCDRCQLLFAVIAEWNGEHAPFNGILAEQKEDPGVVRPKYLCEHCVYQQ